MKSVSRFARFVSVVSCLALALMLVPAVGLPSGSAGNMGVQAASAATQAASTGARYNSGYTSAKSHYRQWSKALDNRDYVAIIPGLASVSFDNGVCRDMVPQGVTTFGNYYLITAYCSKHVHSSVVFVLNKSNGSYVKTIELNDKAHVGAITTDMHGYWKSDFIQNKIEALIPMSDLNPAQRILELQQDDIAEGLAESYDPVSISMSWGSTPHGNLYTSGELGMSYLAAYGTNHYSGRFHESNASLNYMYALWWGNGAPESGRIQLPLKTQGIAFWKSGGQIYLLCMTSYGRKNNSALYVYKVNSGGNAYTVRRPIGKPVATITFPPMAEDICVDNGHLLTCYESAANKYQNGDGKGSSPYPIDRITSHYLPSLLSAGGYKVSGRSSAKGASKRGDDNMVTEIASGTCGESATWTLSSNGVLDIYGSGQLDDYETAAAAPWSAYAAQIKSVSVDSGIENLGDNSFAGCSDLRSVYLPGVDSDSEESVFSIGSKALAECSSLTKVVLEGTSTFSDDALDGVEGVQLQTESPVTGVDDASGATVHEHDYQFAETVEPTCGTSGYDLYRCSCGEEEMRDVVSATGEHDYEVTETHASTCSEAGYEVHTCSICEDSYTTALPLAEHSWQTAGEPDANGMVTDRCSVCEQTRQRSTLVSSLSYVRAEGNRLVEAVGCDAVEEDGAELLWYDARCGVGDQIVLEGDSSVAGTYTCTQSPRGDGNATEATNAEQYAFQTDDGRTLDPAYLTIEDDQSVDNLWTPENPGRITVTYRGVSATTEVGVEPNGITGITYTPGPQHEFIEGKTGSFKLDSSDDVYFDYDVQFAAGDVLSLSMDDGTVREYTYNGEAFVDADGVGLLGEVDLSSEQEFEHWSVAEGGEVTVRYLNRKGTSHVNVVADPEHAGQCRIVFMHKDGTAQTEYVASGGVLEASKVPSVAAATYDSDDCHCLYSWSGRDAEGTECELADLSSAVQCDMYFSERSTLEPCEYVEQTGASGAAKQVCSVCGHVYGVDDEQGGSGEQPGDNSGEQGGDQGGSGEQGGSQGGTASGQNDAAKPAAAPQKSAGLAVGATAKASDLTYKAISDSAVMLTKGATKANVTVPATVTIAGKSYRVTSIGPRAFKGNKRLTKLTVGKNVTSIGKQAFFKCAKLKTIVFKATKLKAGKVGAKAFAGIAKKVQVKCGKKAKAYKKWLYKKGLPKTAKVKK